ncbi:Mobile element protein [hydrothermal vent metagenome]|uniref:Mobile element protein n=1 Tax=hydrothermal vent metagenome TaxID=652676 RepID=A0A3B1AQF8_9ZZZZ
MRCKFINAERARNNTARLCKLFGISRSGFYAWRSRPASKRVREDIVLLDHIQTEFEASHRSYGRPRMVEELRELGFKVGHTRIGRLMRENGIKAVRTRKFKRTTNTNHSFGFAPNILEQNFSASKPNEKWSVDISYIQTRQGWLYLAVVLDLHSRRIVGWAVSDRMKRDLALKALQMAITLRQPKPGLIHHSDRGSQYCATQYQMLLKRHGMIASMSGKGNCYDNAPVEAFFKTIKAELIWRMRFETRYDAEREIFGYINDFYNPRRRHSALGNISPAAYEKLAA